MTVYICLFYGPFYFYGFYGCLEPFDVLPTSEPSDRSSLSDTSFPCDDSDDGNKNKAKSGNSVTELCTRLKPQIQTTVSSCFITKSGGTAGGTGISEEYKESTSVDNTKGFQVDALFQLFRFGTSRPCHERRTIVTLMNEHNNLFAMKHNIRKKYGVTDDARRMNIGTFNIDLGIQHRGDKEIYVSNSQTEWSNQIT